MLRCGMVGKIASSLLNQSKKLCLLSIGTASSVCKRLYVTLLTVLEFIVLLRRFARVLQGIFAQRMLELPRLVFVLY
jgi:hypothetical protein